MPLPSLVHRLEAQRREFGLHDLQLLVRETNAGAEVDRRHNAGLEVLGFLKLGDGAGPADVLATAADCTEQCPGRAVARHRCNG